MTKKTKEEIESDLSHFYGSENYHRYSGLFRNMLLTDGAKYLADETGSYWLMDVIASHQLNLKHQEFQLWKVKCSDEREPSVKEKRLIDLGAIVLDRKTPDELYDQFKGHKKARRKSGDVVDVIDLRTTRSCTIVCENGNGKELVRQDVPFTDFILDEISLYCNLADNNGTRVIFLISEY